jgi:glycerol uptake facilitator-like aquaporin
MSNYFASCASCEDAEGCTEMTQHSLDPTSLDSCKDGASCIRVDRLFKDSPAPVPNDVPYSSTFEVERKLCAEFLGTFILLNLIIGSGIMAERLSPNDVGLQLLENGISVGCGLIGLILMFGPVSGAHFNPVVSLVDFLNGDMSAVDLCMYVVAQVMGGIAGAIVANLQFDHVISLSTKARDVRNLWLGEVIATVTLLLVIHGCVRTGQKSAVPFAVGGWVLSGHFFTSSTIFANPAVTIAREFSNSFAGIRPSSVGPFIGFQLLGAGIAFLLIKFFYPTHLEMRKDNNLYLRICIQQAEKQKSD